VTSGVKDVELVPAKADEQSLAPVQPQGSELVLMFERLAKDPNVDVDKLERLIAMQERILRHQAKAAFDADFAQMQPEIPIVDERGRIEVKGTLRSTYAPLEDIHEVIKPSGRKTGRASSVSSASSVTGRATAKSRCSRHRWTSPSIGRTSSQWVRP
jgi:hypothetical protein